MKYSELVRVYESLSATTKKLEKTEILSKFLKKLKGHSEWIYLFKGRVVPDYDSSEFGISGQLVIKAIGKSYGVRKEDILKKFRKVGDLGEIAESFVSEKKQRALFSSRLTVQKVFDNLSKVMAVEGKGAVEKKMGLISELLTSASGKESKYIVRTLLNDLRVGVADGIIRDAIAQAFFPKEKKKMAKVIERAYDLSNDFSSVLDSAVMGKRSLSTIGLVPGRPMKVMLPVKVTRIKDAFRICGKPAAIEHKYDGFRVVINRKGKDIKLFTRRLEEVTKQFPDVVEAVKRYVKGTEYILDSEVVGYDPKTKKLKPFEAISQRIKRKYEVGRLLKQIPVEVNIFDVVYYGKKNMMAEPFRERRKLLEKIVKNKKYVIRPSFQIVTDNEKKAEKFYEDALKIGEEGVMFKKLDAPYQAGRRVGYIVKMKPEAKDLDLVIVGAEYGTGKRGGLLTSYILACKSGEGYLEVGKVASGFKEKSEEGTTYKEMTEILKPLIIERKGNRVKVKPKTVISVTYQNIQKSPSYSSGYALRFPRVVRYRPDRKPYDIATLKEIKRESKASYTGGPGSLR